MYQLVLLTAFYALTLPFEFVMPIWADAPLMLANGATNMLGQYWWTRAMHLAPTSAVVPFQYFSLIWAMMFGFCDLGRRADRGPAGRLGDRGRIGPVSALARVAAKTPGGAAAVKPVIGDAAVSPPPRSPGINQPDRRFGRSDAVADRAIAARGLGLVEPAIGELEQ